MTLYHSILRKFTSPTCNLEILSPTLPVKQRFLRSRSPEPLSFQLQIHPTNPSLLPVDDTEPTALSINLRGSLEDLQLLHTAVQDYLPRFLGVSEPGGLMMTAPGSDFTHGFQARSVAKSEEAIALYPRTLTQHVLQLGPLQGTFPSAGIQLASTQLYDLASTLDDYLTESADLVAVSVEPENRFWVKALPFAAVSAGLVGLTAAFLTPSLRTQLAFRNDRESPQSAAETQTASPGVLPSLPLGPRAPLAANPPTPQGTSTPNAQANPSIPPIPVLQAPDLPTPNPSLALQPSVAPLIVPSTQKLTPNTQKITPHRQLLEPSPGAVTRDRKTSSPNPAQEVPITIASRPQPKEAQPEAADLAQGAGASLDALSQAIVTPTVGSAQPKDSALSQPKDSSAQPPEGRTRSLETLAPIQFDTAVNSGNAPSANKTGTVLDTIEQVDEVKQYFLSRWKPPADLEQVLEYELMLNSDGSLWKITPLGEAAGQNLSRTGMPALGVPFVSPITQSKTAKIRLVLSPNGQVQTFFEGRPN